MELLQAVKSARQCGVPLIVIRTADPFSTIRRIEASPTFPKEQEPMIQWDVVRGAMGINKDSAEVLEKTLRDSGMEQAQTTNQTEFIAFADKLPRLSIVFMVNLHRFCAEDIGTIQAMANARESFKSANKTIIGLVPSITLPAELSQDVLVLDEPLPTDADLTAIAEDVYKSAQLPAPDPGTVERIVDATLGLAAFPAEQSMAMSITRKGMDIEELWNRKRSVISQCQGLSVVPPTMTFDDIGGVENIKTFMSRVMKGGEPPRCFVWIDEAEKAFAGSGVGTGGGDTSGVSQAFLGTILTDMQDNNYSGAIFVGFPGSAKSLVAKCAGATAGVPTIQFDPAAMKSSFIGSSEAQIRQALSVVKAVSQGRAFFILTSNGITTIPPELKRRCRAGIWMFDFPTKVERDVIWRIYLDRYAARLEGLDLTIPADENWTGAEISVCVDNAYKLRCSLRDAATYVVPTYQAMGQEKVAQLRAEASGRYISASYPGPYQHKRETATALPSSSRAISFND